jgi:pimeloyl-ACP methyl ester carboxylesterase
MARFVPVHGAWHGGWCWKKATPLLHAAGYEVYTPTLTGVGERVHLLTTEINLDTHITDITNVLDYEDLREVILVGHSYGGMVVAGVAEQIPDGLRRRQTVSKPRTGTHFRHMRNAERIRDEIAVEKQPLLTS